MKRYKEELIDKSKNLESSIEYWENQIPIISIFAFLLGVALILCLILCVASVIMKDHNTLQFIFSLMGVIFLLFVIFIVLLWSLPKRIEQLKEELDIIETELNQY